MKKIFFVWILLVGIAYPKDRPQTDVFFLEELSNQLTLEFNQKRNQQLPSILNSTNQFQVVLNNNRDIEFKFFDERGFPLYYEVNNLNAAKSISTDKVWAGGSGGFSLSGATTPAGKFGIWDGGTVLATHIEFEGRVTQQDPFSGIHYHATHVAGTMVAAGLNPLAKGMSYEAVLDAYDWTNDESEMANAAASGMLVSNHSYGYITGWRYSSPNWYWYGDPSLSETEDYSFGLYSSSAKVWDQIAYNAPYYTIVRSAGNDRNDYGPTAGGTHLVYTVGGWTSSNTVRDKDGGTDGYDCIGGEKTGKNVITVGAVNDIVDGYTNPNDVVMSTFSNWGPTDDGRIKPDIVANGVSLTSCDESSSNNLYVDMSGTSMSAPNVSGSINLLITYFINTHGYTPLSSTVKGLVIHTADEAGPDEGPDYMNGWGLMNTLKAAQLIQVDSLDNNYIIEDYLADRETKNYRVYSDGLSPLKFTIVWTDEPGNPPPASLNPTTLMLVNDFDLRVVPEDNSITYFPYVLDPSNPSLAATTADNFRDNVEQVYISAPAQGAYIVSVSHKGHFLSSKRYSIISTVVLESCDNSLDTDSDGITDCFDNCSTLSNSSQDDSDGDAVGDSCDICPGFDDNLDADFDSVPDSCDDCLDFNNSIDLDSDSVPDGCDNCLDVYNPLQVDTDLDGAGDVCDCCLWLRGNVNSSPDDQVDISDLVYLVAFMFQNGNAPTCMEEADINGSGGAVPIDISDLVVLVAYMFEDGTAPASCP